MLGLTLLIEANGMLFFQLAGVRLMVGKAYKPEQPIGGSVPYFDAPDFDAAANALEARGITLLQRRSMGLGVPMTTSELDAWADDAVNLFLNGCRGLAGA